MLYPSSLLLYVRFEVYNTLQRHNTENSKQMFPEKELRGLSRNLNIHVLVSNLYIPMIGLPILLQENMWTELAIILTSNAPVVDMARDIMIWMRENRFRGPLEGVGPENRYFFGP
jgi:hypothetical protein